MKASQIFAKFRDLVFSRDFDQIDGLIDDRVYNQISAQIRAQIDDQLEDQIGTDQFTLDPQLFTEATEQRTL